MLTRLFCYVILYIETNNKTNGESKEYWRAYIKNNGKCISKQFKTKEEAIKWRLQKELELFGKDFAPQRHLFEEYRIYSIDNILKT